MEAGMKRILCVCGLLLGVVGMASGQMQMGAAPAGGANALAPLPVHPAVKKALAEISAARVQADIAKLVTFGTRSTLSSMDTDLPQGQGILAAADWITSEFEGISKECGGGRGGRAV